MRERVVCVCTFVRACVREKERGRLRERVRVSVRDSKNRIEKER